MDEEREGPAEDPDLTIETDVGLGKLLRGEVSAAEARRSGIVRVRGKASLLQPFADAFRLPASAQFRFLSTPNVPEYPGKRALRDVWLKPSYLPSRQPHGGGRAYPHAGRTHTGHRPMYSPEETDWRTQPHRVLDHEGYEWSLGSYRTGTAGWDR